MGELRRDPVVGRWVIVNTQNSMKPEGYEKEKLEFHQQAVCPFCPGREGRTPPEIEAVRFDGSYPNTPGWSVRVVPNRFPALDVHGEIERKAIGLFDMCNGIGAHEIIVETSDHFKDFPELNEHEMFQVINKYCSRAIDLARDKRFEYVLIFKNYGTAAGASLEHAHSQVIALPMIPKSVAEALEGSQAYYAKEGRCVYCDMINQEKKDQSRIIVENDDFICFASFTSRFSFESWIMPKGHRSNLYDLNDAQKYNLGRILKDILRRNKLCLGNPSYNFFIHTAPTKYKHMESYHWHIEIIPKLTNMAGFEWGTGFYVVLTDPTDAAKYLREVA